MAYPPKIEKLYYRVKTLLSEQYFPGAKLPCEREFAPWMGVSRKTIARVLQRLAEEHKVMRDNTGTYVHKETEAPFFRKPEQEPVSILLPAPDYTLSCEFSSRYAHDRTIQGALKAALKHNSRIITIPVTETNNPDEINYSQLRGIHPESRVICNSPWFQKLLPFLYASRCRMGFLGFSREFLKSVPDTTDFTAFCPGNLIESFLRGGIRLLHEAGARNILYFGSNAANASIRGKFCFERALAELQLSPGKFAVYDSSITLQERLLLLKRLFFKEKYDGLILELNPFREHDWDFDFYAETGIPESLPMITAVSDLVFQDKVAQHARVGHYPVMKYSFQTTEFLLSEEHGHFLRDAEYEFPTVHEFMEYHNLKQKGNI